MFFLEPTLFSSTLRSTGLAHIIGTLRGGVSVDTFVYYLYYLYVTLEHKTSVKSLGYIYSNSQKYVWILYGSKLLIFLLCQKSLGY